MRFRVSWVSGKPPEEFNRAAGINGLLGLFLISISPGIVAVLSFLRPALAIIVLFALWLSLNLPIARLLDHPLKQRGRIGFITHNETDYTLDASLRGWLKAFFPVLPTPLDDL